MTDEQVLCEAMGWEWHEPTGESRQVLWDNRIPYIVYRCSCGAEFTDKTDYAELHPTPDFTDHGVLWRVLQYMMGREDWDRFFCFATDEMEEIVMEDAPGYPDGTIVEAAEIKLLFTAPPDGNVRLVGLAARWCREHGG